ncbi:hypothetical protein AVEN_208621-1 [Araneus ventricosus]|uniref:Uncharacterized protein n=1 Tax=Araneus ventricosus TaxID=182803 RepID=A0A4Y2GRH0_ARAVE|nr:hypothetical protein AVEN_208621-1 [Araneus ventricosus]
MVQWKGLRFGAEMVQWKGLRFGAEMVQWKGLRFGVEGPQASSMIPLKIRGVIRCNTVWTGANISGKGQPSRIRRVS